MKVKQMQCLIAWSKHQLWFRDGCSIIPRLRLFGSLVGSKMNVAEATAKQFQEQIREKTEENKSKLTGNKFNVIVEGNIGVGKTTLINYFSKLGNVEIFSEPVEKWRNLNGFNLLNMMYKDPQKWSLTFQSYVQLTMIDLHSRKQLQPVRLMERSLFSAKYCFVENLHHSGKMPDADYLVLTEWFNWLLNNVKVSVDLIVYLRADPEVVHKRILARSRPEENTIPLEYVRQLHRLHEDWLLGQSSFKVPAPVLVLDANENLETMYKMYESKSEEILGNLKSQATVYQ